MGRAGLGWPTVVPEATVVPVATGAGEATVVPVATGARKRTAPAGPGEPGTATRPGTGIKPTATAAAGSPGRAADPVDPKDRAGPTHRAAPPNPAAGTKTGPPSRIRTGARRPRTRRSCPRRPAPPERLRGWPAPRAN